MDTFFIATSFYNVPKNLSSCLTLAYKDGQGVRQQRWESFSTKDEALKFKAKIEYDKSREKMVTPSTQTVGDYLLMWADLYGKSHWGYSMRTNSLAVIQNYVILEIGDIAIQKL